MNKVESSFVGTSVDGNKSTLDKIISGSECFSIFAFSDTISASSVLKSVEFLKNRRGGSVYIPHNGDQKEVVITVKVDKDGNESVRFIIVNYRYPINTETRPYLGTSWSVGDMVINNDLVTNKNLVWVCVAAGTPGIWAQSMVLTSWRSEIETVDALPDASSLQEGRLVVCGGNVYYCAFESTSGKWVWRDTFISSVTDAQIDSLF